MSEQPKKLFSSEVPPIANDPIEDLPIEGTEGVPISQLATPTQLAEMAEFEQVTGQEFETHIPERFYRDEIDESNPHISNFKEHTEIVEQGTFGAVGKKGKFHKSISTTRGFSGNGSVGFDVVTAEDTIGPVICTF